MKSACQSRSAWKDRNAATARAGHEPGVGVQERREHAAVEAHADMTRGKQLQAAARAGREANLAVVGRGEAGQSERAGQERDEASATVFLQPAGLPVVHRDLPANRRPERERWNSTWAR